MQIQMHTHFTHQSHEVDPTFIDYLAARHDQLIDLVTNSTPYDKQYNQKDIDEDIWLARTYPALAILAPVMATSQGKIEYPGDPMCLYSALSVAINQVVKAKKAGLPSQIAQGTDERYPYFDLCPQWGLLPSREYRFCVSDSGIRNYTSIPLNTDQIIFDPRVWNENIKNCFVNNVLKVIQPKVVLISSVSPAHRYAIDIARQVRQYLPQTLIVFGGRHMDETLHFDDTSKKLTLSYSSTFRAILDNRIESIADFVVSGDGYFALDLLMKAISISMDLFQKATTVYEVIKTLEKMAPLVSKIPGKSIIAALDDKKIIHAFPVRGSQFDLAKLPSPYQAFGIRARFPIFTNGDDSIARTAHMMTTSSCPYRCDFCSEGMAVVKQLHRFTHDPVNSAIQRVLEYVSYGAEALFFDDSIFWAGNIKLIKAFSRALSQLKQEATIHASDHFTWLNDYSDINRLIAIQWGAQLTAEFFTTFLSRSEALECLSIMKMAGCTYIYIGIESLASSIMNKIHKNRNNINGLHWAEKIRQALMIAKEVGIRVGSSILFGLDGETRETIEITIEGVGKLIDEGLLYLASPNILTYHPATVITHNHEREEALDYHSLDVPNQPPYIYFEEAFPGVVSKELSQSDIWYIHLSTKERWGHGRHTEPMHIGNEPMSEEKR